MSAAPLPADIPTPRHRAPEEALPAPAGGPRHRATGETGPQVRVAAPEERARRGRHAALADDEAADDPLAWLGFHFENA